MTQTLSAGRGCHSLAASWALIPWVRGIALRRVMSTPLDRACDGYLVSCFSFVLNLA